MTALADPQRPGGWSRVLRWWPIAAAFAVIVAGEALVYAFMRSKGVSSTGDEPHYLIVAKALSHFTVHPLQAYKVDLRTHQIYAWPPGTEPTNLTLELYSGPHGPVSTHNLGLSALLAPFVAVGGAVLARVGLMAIETAGFIYFYLRSAILAGLSRAGRVVFAIMIAGPAIWVAGTQIYPDLLTGILVACVLVEVAAVESQGHLSLLGTAVAGFSLAVLPWLHQQNLVPAVLALISLAVVSRHAVVTGHAQVGRSLVVIAIVSAASWLLLLAYNLYDYGHPLGLPQPFPSLNKAGITDILGLLFDRHQGMFVQVPTVTVGLVGLWLARRRTPVAMTATLASAASLIYLNGTFIGAPYGGTSFAGRFEWSSLVPLLVWCPPLIAALGSKARIWGLGAVAALLWVLESVPILRGDHIYYNQLVAGPPWDPSTYPGWWGGFDRLLPEMIPRSRLFGWPWFALPIELILLVLVAALALRLTRPRQPATLRLGILSASAVVATGVLALAAPLPLPSRPQAYTDQDLGGPIQSGAAPASTAAVPLQGVGAGTFQITATYALHGKVGSATMTAYCTHGTAKSSSPATATARPTIVPGNHTTIMTLHCPTGTIWFQMAVQPATRLAIDNLALTKNTTLE